MDHYIINGTIVLAKAVKSKYGIILTTTAGTEIAFTHTAFDKIERHVTLSKALKSPNLLGAPSGKLKLARND